MSSWVSNQRAVDETNNGTGLLWLALFVGLACVLHSAWQRRLVFPSIRRLSDGAALALVVQTISLLVCHAPGSCSPLVLALDKNLLNNICVRGASHIFVPRVCGLTLFLLFSDRQASSCNQSIAICPIGALRS